MFYIVGIDQVLNGKVSLINIGSSWREGARSWGEILSHLDNGAGFPERNALVGILDSRHTAIGIHVDIWLLLEAFELDPRGLVRDVQLLKYDEDFRGIGNLVYVSVYVSTMRLTGLPKKRKKNKKIERLQSHSSSIV